MGVLPNPPLYFINKFNPQEVKEEILANKQKVLVIPQRGFQLRTHFDMNGLICFNFAFAPSQIKPGCAVFTGLLFEFLVSVPRTHHLWVHSPKRAAPAHQHK